MSDTEGLISAYPVDSEGRGRSLEWDDFEAPRARVAVTNEEFAGRTAEELNRRMHALSVIAGLFLPLSFATGLLGIHVAGIQGAEARRAFAARCAVLSLLAVAEIFLFRRLRWI